MGMRTARTVCVIVALLACCAFIVSAGGKQEVKKQQVQIFTHYQEATKQKGVDVLMAGAETKYPQYDFVAEHMAYSQFLQVIKTRMASGDAPDVFQGRPYEYPEFIKAGEIVELTKQPFVSRIEEDALIENMIDGKLWALPTDVEARGIFYNKKMFKDAGLKPPTTRSEWLAACTKFKNTGTPPVSFGFKQQNVCYDQLEACLVPRLIKNNDPNLYGEVIAGKRKFADSKDFRDALRDMNEMLLAFMDPGDVGVVQEQSYKNWAGEKRPMVHAGTWALADFRVSNPKGSLGVIAFPLFENAADNGIEFGTDDNYMVSSKSKAINGAYAFLDYTTSLEGIKAWNKEAMMITTVKGVTYENPDEMIVDVMNYIKKGQMYVRVGATPPSGEYYVRMFENAQAYVAMNPADRLNYDKWINQLDQEFAAVK